MVINHKLMARPTRELDHHRLQLEAERRTKSEEQRAKSKERSPGYRLPGSRLPWPPPPTCPTFHIPLDPTTTFPLPPLSPLPLPLPLPMPSLFSRAFSCACSSSCTTEDVPKSSSFPAASPPTSNSNSWLGRVLLRAGFGFSIMRERERKQGDGNGTELRVASFTYECKPRSSKTRYRLAQLHVVIHSSTYIHIHRPSSNAISEVSSIPSLSRLDSTVSSVSAASSPSPVSSPVRYDLLRVFTSHSLSHSHHQEHKLMTRM